jgi:hypothetical protein
MRRDARRHGHPREPKHPAESSTPRRPPRHYRHPQRHRHAPLFRRQPNQRRRKQCPWRNQATASTNGIRFPRRSQIRQQSERVRIQQTNILDIRHRQHEPRPLQQMRAIAQLRERRDPRRRPARDLRLRLGQCRTQFRQRPQSRQTGQQHPLGPQRLAQLQQRARQVVDPVQRQAGHDQIEAARPKRQALLVRHHAQPAVPRRHPRRQIATDHPHPTLTQQRRHHPASAHIQHIDEPPVGIIHAVQQPFGGIAQHVRDLSHRGGGPFAMQADSAAIEY